MDSNAATVNRQVTSRGFGLSSEVDGTLPYQRGLEPARLLMACPARGDGKHQPGSAMRHLNPECAGFAVYPVLSSCRYRQQQPVMLAAELLPATRSWRVAAAVPAATI